MLISSLWFLLVFYAISRSLLLSTIDCQQGEGGVHEEEAGLDGEGAGVDGHVTVLYVSNIIHNSLVLRVASVHLDIVP